MGLIGCFQCVKVIKFESNSQHNYYFSNYADSCFQCVKVIKFESNSQHAPLAQKLNPCCFQCVKVIKFESNSQPLVKYRTLEALFSVCQSYKV